MLTLYMFVLAVIVDDIDLVSEFVYDCIQNGDNPIEEIIKLLNKN